LNFRPVVAECTGTAFLLAAVVGSGMMAQRLCGRNAGLALLAKAVATGVALVALILAFGPKSGAHFNPAVTLADAWPAFVVVQLLGAFAATALFAWLAPISKAAAAAVVIPHPEVSHAIDGDAERP
jgi:glycerol uptake facilitator-like aquaporin